DDYDDWDLNRNPSDDWDFEEAEKEYFESSPRPEYTKIQDDRDYDDFQEPENDYARTSNPYSYDERDRDLNDSGSGKTESVYDADYRVIIPPPAASTNSQNSENSQNNQDADNWDFLDEDFTEDKSPPNKLLRLIKLTVVLKFFARFYFIPQRSRDSCLTLPFIAAS
ncbi:MAG: hypothetical protein AAFS12_19295, partial [Cyanobacteria bacterium J06632_19]